MTDHRAPDPAAYIHRVRAEIEAQAETLRRQDPQLERRERDIERAWIEVAPPGAAGSQRELLLDRADRLAMIDVDVPLGERPGIRQAKGAIRKGMFWYLRYVTDQINALTNVLTRLLRRLDERVAVLEADAALADTDGLVDPVPEASAAVGEAVAGTIAPGHGRGVILGCGSGVLVEALSEAGVSVYGVDRDPVTILAGVQTGLDLRAGDPVEHLREAVPGSFDLIVVSRFVEELAPTAAHRMVRLALAALADRGLIVVASADPADRDVVEAELRAGRGLSATTWAHLLDRAGFDTALVATTDERIGSIVVGRAT